MVEAFGELEAEYAALRKGCVLLDLPHRGVLRISGRERLDFLGRMVTQEMKGFAPGEVRRGFWLSRKGRVTADLRMVQMEDRMVVDVDVLAAAPAAATLTEFLFGEDVVIEDVTASMHRLGVHGPKAAGLLAAVSTAVTGGDVAALGAERAVEVLIAGHRVLVFRDDSTGSPGFELVLEVGAVTGVYEQLLEKGMDAGVMGERPEVRFRTAGWHAFNIARIEAGRAVFNIDFGSESLPHEAGPEVLKDRVSFTKGCYLGQEIVARMQSLGHPKQRLVGLLPDEAAAGEDTPERQPEGGSAVLLPVEGGEPKAVGVVTSSTRSPMLGDRPICLAQVKWDQSQPGTRLAVQCGGGVVGATVQGSTVFWRAGPA